MEEAQTERQALCVCSLWLSIIFTKPGGQRGQHAFSVKLAGDQDQGDVL